MKSRTISVVILGLALTAVPWRLAAQPSPNPPGQISYQGFLTDANGIPLATNTPVNYNIQFRVFDASTAGNLKWAEQQVVTVDRGYFTVMLGNGVSLAGPAGNLTSIFSGTDASDRYLEITVLGLAPGDPPIAPRLRLLSAPYSFLANTALNVDGGALTTGTVDDARLSANVALRAGGNNFTSDQHFTAGDLYLDNGHAIYAKNALTGGNEVFVWPRYGDNVTYLNYGANGFNIRNNANATTMFMDNRGNVGIGTAPGFPLNFAPALGDKISLYGNSGNHYGFGIQVNQLQIHTDVSSSDVVFGYGQSGSFNETMRVKGNGNVGIGTASPGAKLDVNGGVSLSGNLSMNNGATMQARNSGGIYETFLWPRWSDNVTYLNYGSGGFNIRNNTSATTLFLQNNGMVGIGTTSPSKGALEIDSGAGYQPGYNPTGFLTKSGASSGNVGAGGDISLWASGWVFADTYVAFSDERIKSIKGQSDSAADLKTLLGIQITDFSYRDTVANGAGLHKKVIAQQVQQVYPQAVSLNTNVVPDIYTNATVENGWVLLATDLKVGDRVKLIGGNETGVHEVVAVRPGAFRVDFDPASHRTPVIHGSQEGGFHGGADSATNQVFVYGREVKDFRSVDYEAISMLNVSATQELAKRLQKLEAREAHLADLEQKASRVATLELELADLKKTVARLAAADRSKQTVLAVPEFPASAAVASFEDASAKVSWAH